MQTILSYGMGVESTAILVRWLEDASARPCELGELIVITAHTGDEYADTYRDVETYVLPLLRKHRVRYVQVARGGHSQSDGIVVLSDSRETGKLFWDGAYKLSDELRKAEEELKPWPIDTIIWPLDLLCFECHSSVPLPTLETISWPRHF